MEIFKKISAAILLATVIGVPLALLEALSVYSIVNLYEIPYLSNFHYFQILGLSFIIMITRNRIRFTSESCKEIKEDNDPLMPEIIIQSSNRLFRIAFVWGVALVVNYLFFKIK